MCTWEVSGEARERERAVGTGASNVIGGKVKSLVCPFWATVETWQCNMADSVERRPAPYVDINILILIVRSKVTKT